MKETDVPLEKRRTRLKTSAAIVKAEAGVEKPKATSSRSRRPSLDPIEDLVAVL